MITYLNHATLNKSHLVPMAPSSTCPFPKPLQPQLLIPIKQSFWPRALIVCLPSPSLGPSLLPPISSPSPVQYGPSRRSGCTFPHFYNKPFSSTIPPWGIMSSFSFLWVSGSLFCNFDCPEIPSTFERPRNWTKESSPVAESPPQFISSQERSRALEGQSTRILGDPAHNLWHWMTQATGNSEKITNVGQSCRGLVPFSISNWSQVPSSILSAYVWGSESTVTGHQILRH